MAHVNVSINGRQFRMACEDGEEDHLIQLATEFEQRVSELRGKFGEVGDIRLTIMAALTVADELGEAGRKIKRLEDELLVLRSARSMTTDRDRTRDATIAAALNGAAERIEAVAKRLNQSLSDGVPMG